MTYVNSHAETAPAVLVRACLRALWGPMRQRLETRRTEREYSDALKELSRFEDYQLADIGLCRSDLTADGLRVAGARRAARQEDVNRVEAVSRKAA